MSIHALKGVWWRKVDRTEKIWLGLALAWCLILFAMTPLWHWKGGQNPSFETYRTTPADFRKKVDAFVAKGKIGEEMGMPIVAGQPDEDLYMLGRLWAWYPALKLKKGQTYRLHLSSMDLVHGFSLFPLNLNFMVLPARPRPRRAASAPGPMLREDGEHPVDGAGGNEAGCVRPAAAAADRL
jgi:cytochrome c oxidase subunit II